MALELAPMDLNFGIQPVSYAGPSFASQAYALPGMQTAPQVAGPSFTDKANLALSGLQTLGGLWGAFQAQKLAKKQFNFTKEFALTNLANQIKSYNTALADRARSRGVMEGQSPDQVSSYISANALSNKSSNSGVGGITAAALSNYGSYSRPTDETIGR